MPADVLKVTGLTVTAPGGRVLLDAVDLALAPGRILGLTGPAGSGKSVLAHALMGITRPPLAVVAGSVSIKGTDLLALPPKDAARVRGRDIALIVQNPRAALHPMLPVGRQIGRIWSTHHRGDRKASDVRAVDLLRLVGINDAERRAQAFVHELSGGMAQRVLIAAALSAEPAVLVADEPTSGLDVTVQASFLDMMARAARDRGTAMLLVTQEPGILANYCDEIAVLEEGRLIARNSVIAHFAGSREATIAIPAAIEAPALLRAEGVRKQFALRQSRAVVHAVDNLDLDVRSGETLGLVGESGSGKTTAGRTLLRLIEPDAGRILIDGVDLTTLTPSALRRLRARIQLVRQDPFDSFDPRWTIMRAIAEPLRTHGAQQRAAIAERVDALLAMVGLTAEEGMARPRDLPAGTLQRAAIARALATDPRFVVLDEPTSVLTPDARAMLIALLRRLQAKTGTAFLFISHDLTTVAAVSHRVAVMYLGQIVETGTTQQIFHAPRHPYTRALIAAHLEIDPAHRRVDRLPEARFEGEIPSPIDLPPGCYFASRCSHAVDRCWAERQILQPWSGGAVRCWRAVDLLPFSGRSL